MAVWPVAPLVILLAGSGACTSRVDREDLPLYYPDEYVTGADLLWLPGSATIEPEGFRPVATRNGRSIYIDGSAGVSFLLVTVDRERVTRQLTEYFDAMGWTPRDTQFLNPTTPTSFGGGWRGQCACLLSLDENGKPIPRERLYLWQGEWHNARGNLITYFLMAEGYSVRGRASFRPKEWARMGPASQTALSGLVTPRTDVAVLSSAKR